MSDSQRQSLADADAKYQTGRSLHDTARTETIRPFLDDDADWAQRLWAREFGAESGWEYEYAASADRPDTAGFVAEVDGQPAGYGIVHFVNYSWIEDTFDIEITDHITHTHNGLLHHNVVAPQFRGRGLGKQLVQARLDWLRNHDESVYHALAMCWQRDGAVSSADVLDRFGFETAEYYPEYYDVERPCPDCEGVCQCDAVLMVKEVDDGE